MYAYDDLEDVREIANEHLRAIDAIHTTPTDLRLLAAHLGIRLVLHSFWGDPSYTGSAFIRDEDDFRLIVGNSLLPRPRLAFTVAHEIAHMALGHRPPRRGITEHSANVYAAEVLMPTERLVRQIHNWGNDASYLAGLNGVSLSAMRLRLQEIGVMFARETVSVRCDGRWADRAYPEIGDW